jgi:S-formylglutathione hydrolase FrmB
MSKKLYKSILNLLFSASLIHASSEAINIPSSLMKKISKACIITPSDYTPEKRYSVIYLLHGYGGNYKTWPDIVPLLEYANKFQVLFVCPDGNHNSWYLDSPVKKKSLYESYIIKELIPFVDSHYSTWSEANGRAIIGISMGGHGATTLLAKYPEIFIGAVSLSGIMDLTEFPLEWDIAALLGSYQKNKMRWYESSFVGQISKLTDKNRTLILDCGLSDFALPGNQKAHAILLENKIPHEYFERPGAHNHDYSAQNARFHFEYFSKYLLKPGLKK